MERSGRIADLVQALSDDSRRPLVERALLAALEGGSLYILTDLLLRHPDRRVRNRLARLMASSGDPALAQQLEQVQLAPATRDQQRVVRWVIGRLRAQASGLAASPPAVAV